MTQLWQKLFYATGCVFELARGVILFAVVLGLVTAFVATVNIVNGVSMEPNFHNGQLVLVDKLSYNQRDPRRGEAVTIKFPGDPEKVKYIKRIVGMPGEKVTIANNTVFIDDKPLRESYIPEEYLTDADQSSWQLGSGEYFLMGDNRENSNDSRVFGPVERRFLLGLAYFIIWPFGDAALVPPVYY